MRQKLAPILLDDHDLPDAQRHRTSIVQPAQRSTAARKPTDDSLPVLDFRDLLAHLGTVIANEMEVPEQTQTFTVYPTLTPLQQRSFDLLAVPHRL